MDSEKPKQTQSPESKNQKITPPTLIGSEKFNYYMGVLVTVAGAIVGGTVSEGITNRLVNNIDYTSRQINQISAAGWLTGAVIGGVFIPLDLYRRSQNKSWSDIRQSFNSFFNF